MSKREQSKVIESNLKQNMQRRPREKWKIGHLRAKWSRSNQDKEKGEKGLLKHNISKGLENESKKEQKRKQETSKGSKRDKDLGRESVNIREINGFKKKKDRLKK